MPKKKRQSPQKSAETAAAKPAGASSTATMQVHLQEPSLTPTEQNLWDNKLKTAILRHKKPRLILQTLEKCPAESIARLLNHRLASKETFAMRCFDLIFEDQLEEGPEELYKLISFILEEKNGLNLWKQDKDGSYLLMRFISSIKANLNTCKPIFTGADPEKRTHYVSNILELIQGNMTKDIQKTLKESGIFETDYDDATGVFFLNVQQEKDSPIEIITPRVINNQPSLIHANSLSNLNIPTKSTEIGVLKELLSFLEKQGIDEDYITISVEDLESEALLKISFNHLDPERKELFKEHIKTTKNPANEFEILIPCHVLEKNPVTLCAKDEGLLSQVQQELRDFFTQTKQELDEALSVEELLKQMKAEDAELKSRTFKR